MTGSRFLATGPDPERVMDSRVAWLLPRSAAIALPGSGYRSKLHRACRFAPVESCPRYHLTPRNFMVPGGFVFLGVDGLWGLLIQAGQEIGGPRRIPSAIGFMSETVKESAGWSRRAPALAAATKTS